eukprot:TRINITY_DN37801_c0_g1_i1.p1 TRINITY_DN37801_c0_g1~~TRINITY_DN37801_c0_g1_i1.p1  ORF type:complete len:469 (+),score=69.88 TRINITY_DN37801_c0_g1_i1:106-1512(+)
MSTVPLNSVQRFVWGGRRDGISSNQRTGVHRLSNEHAPNRVEMYVAGEIEIDGLARLEERCDLSDCTKLGSGSQGEVFLAYDRVLGKEVAVKAVSVERLHRSDRSEEASLRREISAMLSVSHPNIVRLLDVRYCTQPLLGAVTSPPFACLVMEHIANSQPLSTLIQKGVPLPQMARQIVPQLACAMMHMHSRGYVHRDLWSENVLFDGEGRVVIIDLGCASKFTSGPDANNKMNVPYMSPQAYRGERQQPGDDCWTFGCLVAELICGRFVANAVGRHDVPLHSSPPTMKHIINECYRLGCNRLGDLVAGLWDLRADSRLTMRDVWSRVQTSIDNLPELCRVPRVPSYASTTASSEDFLPFEVFADGSKLFGDQERKQPLASPLSPTTGKTDSSFSSEMSPVSLSRCFESRLVPGARMSYLARSHNGEYNAIVVGREPGRMAWRVHVEGSGDKILEESELWRLRQPVRK